MSGGYLVRLTARAWRDLNDIYDYIEQQSPQNAAYVAAELLSTIDSLADFPQRHPVHRHSRAANLTVRYVPVLSFKIYYRVDSSRAAVEVARIGHSARRPPTRFGG